MSSHLFVPACRPDRFAKACLCQADSVVLDLEDTVADHAKSAARQAVAQFDFTCHQAHETQELWLRINSDHHLDEDLALAKDCPVSALVVPKACLQTLDKIGSATHLPLIAVIETTQGLLQLEQIAQHKAVKALSFGILDLALALGVVLGSDGAKIVFDQVRFRLLLASKIAKLQAPIETIFKDFNDTQGFIKNARTAFEMGFGGQFCIHPNQVSAACAAYQPSEQQKHLAQRIVNHHTQTGEFAFALDGMMVDLPLIVWAKNVLV